MPLWLVVDTLDPNEQADELVAQRAAESFGSLRPVGKGFIWELHSGGLPGLLRKYAPPSPTYLSRKQAWVGLLETVKAGIRAGGKVEK